MCRRAAADIIDIQMNEQAHGRKHMAHEKEKGTESGLWYVIGGMAIGTALGMLFAPKKGSELREDLGEWGRKGRDTSRTLMSKLGAMVPFRVKAAAAFGAAKSGGAEAIREAKEVLSFDGARK